MDQIRTLLACDNPEVDGSGIRIAVLDTGIDHRHPDFEGRVDLAQSASFSIDNSIDDFDGHGTHVAGLIAGSGTASDGLYRGVAPGATLIVIKVSDDGEPYSDDVAAGVQAAIAAGADIINYSGGLTIDRTHVGPPPWRWPASHSVLDELFMSAARAGILCIAAAGNDGPTSGTVIRPGSLEDVLSVGALTRELTISPSSSRGPVYLDPTLRRNDVKRADMVFDRVEVARFNKPDIVAPGGSAMSPAEIDACHRRRQFPFGDGPIGPRSSKSRYPAMPEAGAHGGCYTRIAGTSQATALVSGLAALTLQLALELGLPLGNDKARALRMIIRKSAQPIADASQYDVGHGMVYWPNLKAMVEDCVRDPDTRSAVIDGDLRLV